jgi:tetratricopeptide (TPR) repeat protein
MSASTELEIRHCPEHGPRSFRVCRDSETQPGAIVELLSPYDQPVTGLPDSNLMRELRWYLEEFLDYPFPPETTRAERLLAALKDWGQAACRALFGRQPSEEAVAVVADGPSVFGWPWEALADEQGHWLSEMCGIQRRPSSAARVAELPDGLARDRVRILLVIARSGANDVRFRSLARPVVELIERERLPAEIEVLRPPTFGRLRKHLEEQTRAGRPYHLVHFDGHGYSGLCPDPKRRDGRRTGWLLFEDGSGQPDWIDAETFSQALSACGVPAVVLNACQSALVEEEAADSSASVAHALLHAGVRAVVAMSYSVYVSAARVFMPAFYRRLFATGRLSDAVHAGQRELHGRPERVCARSTYPLRDALVPVLYQQAPLAFEFAAQSARVEAVPSRLPEAARQGFDGAGFVGRDGEILQLERALHDPHHSAILIQGMGGQGKTALAKAFLRWLEQTGGLGDGVFWFSFESCRNVEAFFNRLGEQLFGPDFTRHKWEERLRQVTEECRKKRLRIVWDNFESVLGVPGTEVTGLLSDEDAAILRRFLFDLRQGRSKVLITSRSPETWLDPQSGPTSVLRLRSLGGLDGEERWELASAILQTHGLTRQAESPALHDLIESLRGHPLSMRVVLPRLRERAASDLLVALRNNVADLRSANAEDAELRLFALLKLATEDLPAAWRPLLLGLHEGFVDGDHLAAMATQVDAGCTRQTVDDFLAALARGGLLRDHGRQVFEMHPALAGYLRTTPGSKDGQRLAWGRAFIGAMSSVAVRFSPLEAHQQRAVAYLHQANFQAARRAAREAGLHADYSALTEALASFAQRRRDFRTAGELYRALAEHHQERWELGQSATAYHHLGMIAREERDLETARGWYVRALAVGKLSGNEDAATYDELGRIDLEQRNFAASREWYLKSLDVTQKQGKEQHAARTLHQLGLVAEQELDFAAAREWYLKSLAIKEKHGNEHDAAITYHQLGMLALGEGDLATARQCCLQSLAIEEKLGNEHHAALSYAALGNVALRERDLASARRWYLKSLAIDEKLGNNHNAAATWNNLGRVAWEERDFASARAWYLKSLEIRQKEGDEHEAARIWNNLGEVAREERDFAAARAWYLKSLEIRQKEGDEHQAAGIYHNLGMIAQDERDFAAARAWYVKSVEIRKKEGHEQLAAITCHQLGQVAEAQRDFAAARQWYVESLGVRPKEGDERLAAITCHQLGRIAEEERDLAAAREWYLKSLAIDEKRGNEEGAAATCAQLGVVAEAERDFAAARQWYLKVLAITERMGDEQHTAKACLKLGIVAQAEGDFTSAGQWYHKALVLTRRHGNKLDEVTAYGQLGILAALEGRFGDAGPWLLRAILGCHNLEDTEGVRRNAGNFRIAYRKAPRAARRQLRLQWIDAGLDPDFLDEEALAEQDQAIQLTPALPEAHLNRGITRANLCRYEGALADFNQALQLDPELALAYEERGITYYALGRYEEALADFNQALRLDPTSPLPYTHRGNTFAALGRDEDAFADFATALRIDPDFADAYLDRGTTYAKRGSFEEAREDFTRTVHLNPSHARAHLNLGLLHAKRGDMEAALPAFEQAAQLGHRRGYLNVGMVHAQLGDPGSALPAFEQAARMGEPEAARYAAWAREKLGRQPDRVVTSPEEAFEGAHAWAWRGDLYGQQGKYAEALECFEKALRCDPSYVPAQRGAQQSRELLERERQSATGEEQ